MSQEKVLRKIIVKSISPLSPLVLILIPSIFAVYIDKKVDVVVLVVEAAGVEPVSLLSNFISPTGLTQGKVFRDLNFITM